MMKKINKGIFIFLAIAAVLVLLIFTVIFAARLLLVFDNDGNVSAVDRNSGNGDEERLNVLVMGKDKTSGLYDMIMLVSYNMTGQSVGVVQIPRDTYAEYTSVSYKKINGAVSALGGEREFCAFLSDALCVRIDNYVSVNLDAVGEIVDLIGGVEVDIPFDMNYKDPAQGLSIKLKKGKTLLDGETAQQFVRYRSGYADGDLGRIDAQKIFLAAFASKLRRESSLIKISEMLVAVSNDIKTNIPMSDVAFLAKQAFSIPQDKVKFVTLAGEGAVAKASGASYYVVSRSAAIEIVNEFLGGNADEESFDKNRAFLNDRYDTFSKIYYSYTEYKVYDAKSLVLGSTDILHK